VSLITDPHVDVSSITTDAQVILLDLKFNGISGLDVLKDIRRRNPSLPVLIVTGHREEMAASIEAALEINAHACLYKPLEIPRLLDMLAQIQRERLRNLIKEK
jgi:two-component system C4-dicarboxylate transport response regulator DctD